MNKTYSIKRIVNGKELPALRAGMSKQQAVDTLERLKDKCNGLIKRDTHWLYDVNLRVLGDDDILADYKICS